MFNYQNPKTREDIILAYNYLKERREKLGKMDFIKKYGKYWAKISSLYKAVETATKLETNKQPKKASYDLSDKKYEMEQPILSYDRTMVKRLEKIQVQDIQFTSAIIDNFVLHKEGKQYAILTKKNGHVISRGDTIDDAVVNAVRNLNTLSETPDKYFKLIKSLNEVIDKFYKNEKVKYDITTELLKIEGLESAIKEVFTGVLFDYDLEILKVIDSKFKEWYISKTTNKKGNKIFEPKTKQESEYIITLLKNEDRYKDDSPELTGNTVTTDKSEFRQPTDKDTVEDLYTKSKFDSKHIKNLAQKVNVNLDELEKGVTYEHLLNLKVPVCFYQTQLTIHGEHDVKISRVGGYKNLFMNKNKSLGVRYSAIDNAKKSKIGKYCRSWGRFVSSNENFYYIQKHVTKDNYEQTLKDMQTMAKRIDPNLFIGSVNLYLLKVPMLGNFLELKVDINAIKEENVNKLIVQMENKSISKIEKELQEIEIKREHERKLYNIKREKEAEENTAKNKVAFDKYLKQTLIKETDKVGDYLQFDLNSTYSPVRIIKIISKDKRGLKVLTGSGATIEDAQNDMNRSYHKPFYYAHDVVKNVYAMNENKFVEKDIDLDEPDSFKYEDLSLNQLKEFALSYNYLNKRQIKEVETENKFDEVKTRESLIKLFNEMDDATDVIEKQYKVLKQLKDNKPTSLSTEDLANLNNALYIYSKYDFELDDYNTDEIRDIRNNLINTIKTKINKEMEAYYKELESMSDSEFIKKYNLQKFKTTNYKMKGDKILSKKEITIKDIIKEKRSKIMEVLKPNAKLLDITIEEDSGTGLQMLIDDNKGTDKEWEIKSGSSLKIKYEYTDVYYNRKVINYKFI